MDEEEQKNNNNGGLGFVDKPTKAKDADETDSEDEYDCQVSNISFNFLFFFVV